MFPPSPEVVTETLDRLEFPLECETPECGLAPDLFLTIRPCGHDFLSCHPHAREAAQAIRAGEAGCPSCGRTARGVKPYPIPGEVH